MDMNRVSRSFIAFFTLAAATGASGSAYAGLTGFTPTDLSSLTGDSATQLIQAVAIGADHHAYMPATPLGVLIGIDLGVDVTSITLPTAFINTMATITGQATGNIPTNLLVPKLNIHKGLPWGLDLGFSWVSVPNSAVPGTSLATSYGGDIKWAFLRGGLAAPSVAVRGSGSYNTVSFLSTHTYSLDVLAGKNFYIIDPYLGTGLQFWSGDINVPVGIPGLPATVSSHQSGSNMRFFAGAALKLLILRIVGEYDYSTASLQSFGLKVSLGF